MKTCLFIGLLVLSLANSAAIAKPGGNAVASVTNKDVVAAAEFAITAQEEVMKDKDESTAITLVKILGAEEQVVAGMNYRLDLEVTVNGETKAAEAVVWLQSWRNPDPYRLTSWKWKKQIQRQMTLPPLVFVITGESNSGGLGSNAQATPAEQKARPSVQIMNLTNGRFTFEPLHLGVNNLRAHVGLQKYYDTCHGFENQLANAVETNALPGYKQVYLIKTGHGGSRIAQWGGQAPGGYWDKFLKRTEAGKRQLPANARWVVWLSLGINDSIARTPVTAWKKKTLAHLKRIKAQLPNVVIVMTQFQSMGYPQINAAIAAIAAEEKDVFVVDSKGAALSDKNHWSYKGLKTVTKRMIKVTQDELGLRTTEPRRKPIKEIQSTE